MRTVTRRPCVDDLPASVLAALDFIEVDEMEQQHLRHDWNELVRSAAGCFVFDIARRATANADTLLGIVRQKNRAGERETECARMAALTVVLANACHAFAQRADFGVVRKADLPFPYITSRKIWGLCK